MAERDEKRRSWIRFGALTVGVLVINAPILLMMANSFKSTGEILSSSSFLPNDPTLENFTYLTERTLFWTWFQNSVVVALVGTLASIVVAAFAGYALSRFTSRPIRSYSRAMLMLQMFPVILALIPLFIVFRNLDLIDRPVSVIILYTSAHLPFAIWMFKAFIDGVPRELEEAAWMDGCSRLRGFLQIILPISGPGIAAVAIFSFLFSWNEYLIALVFLPSQDSMTLPVGIQMFMQQYASNWGSLMAAATLTMVPTFVLLLFVQKYMLYGAAAGSVKG